MKNTSLAKRILTLGLALTLVPLLTAGGVVYFTGRTAQQTAHERTLDLARADMEHIVELVDATCEVFIAERERELEETLGRARDVLSRQGSISVQPDRTAPWEAVNQFTQQARRVSLGAMLVGGRRIERISDPAQLVPEVDHIRNQLGAAATIFQRMDDSGDMLRVATNVIGADGRRAVGTYLPAIGPDGLPNPVLARVLKGETFVGRAFVVDRWYMSAYEPIRSRGGQVDGMLFVGVPEGDAVENLLNRLMQVKVGRTGYIFVLNAKGEARGKYVLSLDRKRDGERILEARDADGRLFIQEIVDTAVKLGPGQTAQVDYPWKNDGDPQPVLKTAIFRYFAPWDWVIAASVPMAEYTEAADEVAALNFRAQVALAGVTLLAAIASVIGWRVFSRRTDATLTSVIDELRTGSEQVVSAATQVATAAQSLSQGATEQAAALEETSASMEEMASMTRKNAESTDLAAKLVTDVDARVAESNQALTAMVASMSSIQDSSAKVGRIIRTIDEIAFQTNILALNAAVEAARAGEAGMGFAVVADEVRNLAQRSAQAAKDTAALIEQSIASSAEGGERVTRVAASIGGITESVTRVKGLVAEVSVASRQQSQGIEQVTQAVAQMEKVTQTTAATAEESAAASEELNAQAESSLGAVRTLERFIRGDAAGAPARVGEGQPRRAPSRPTAHVIPLAPTGTEGRF